MSNACCWICQYVTISTSLVEWEWVEHGNNSMLELNRELYCWYQKERPIRQIFGAFILHDTTCYNTAVPSPLYVHKKKHELVRSKIFFWRMSQWFCLIRNVPDTFDFTHYYSKVVEYIITSFLSKSSDLWNDTLLCGAKLGCSI